MRNVFIVISLLVFAHTDAQTQLPDGVVLHRMQDTTKDESGYYFGKSTEGHFSVNLPIPFNDFTFSVEDSNIGMIHTYGIGSTSEEKIKIGVVEMMFTPKSTKITLEDMPKSFSKPGDTVSAINNTPYEGYKSVSFTLQRQNSGCYAKYVLTPKSIITMTIEFPREYAELAEQVMSIVFPSLKITK